MAEDAMLSPFQAAFWALRELLIGKTPHFGVRRELFRSQHSATLPVTYRHPNRNARTKYLEPPPPPSPPEMGFGPTSSVSAFTPLERHDGEGVDDRTRPDKIFSGKKVHFFFRCIQRFVQRALTQNFLNCTATNENFAGT